MGKKSPNILGFFFDFRLFFFNFWHHRFEKVPPALNSNSIYFGLDLGAFYTFICSHCPAKVFPFFLATIARIYLFNSNFCSLSKGPSEIRRKTRLGALWSAELWPYGLWCFQMVDTKWKYFCLRINIPKGNYWILD